MVIVICLMIYDVSTVSVSMVTIMCLIVLPHHTDRLPAHQELGRLDGEVLHGGDQRVVQVGDDDFACLVTEEGDKASNTIIKLVVPEGHRVKLQQVVKLGHDLPLELGVPDSALEEISSIEPQDVL